MQAAASATVRLAFAASSRCPGQRLLAVQQLRIVAVCRRQQGAMQLARPHLVCAAANVATDVPK